MDTFITIISWLGGFALFFISLLLWSFAEGAYAQTGKTDGRIISLLSLALVVWLVWMGGSSIYDALFAAPDHIPTIKEKAHREYLQKIFFALAWIALMIWVFTPSKKKDQSKDKMREEMLEKLLDQFFKNKAKNQKNDKPKE